jgi:hypothetical protein
MRNDEHMLPIVKKKKKKKKKKKVFHGRGKNLKVL